MLATVSFLVMTVDIHNYRNFISFTYITFQYLKVKYRLLISIPWLLLLLFEKSIYIFINLNI
jgi:hypothetical protein